MNGDVSFEFLACLQDYRRKYVMMKAFRAWRKYLTSVRRRYKKACLVLEYWGHHTMKKCFDYLKGQRQSVKPKGIPYSKGIYLIILAASTFLAPKTFVSSGCRIDKILSLFKQSSILQPNIAVLKDFVKSWEKHLLFKYFGLLKKRWRTIKLFKIKRIAKLRAKSFRFLKTCVRSRLAIRNLERFLKMYCWRQLRLTAEHGKIDGMRDALALEFMKKLYLQKCFNVLSEYTQWNREHNEKSSLAEKFYDLSLMMKSFKHMKVASKTGRKTKKYTAVCIKSRNSKLLGKALKVWKKYKGNKKGLTKLLKEYTIRKEMLRKRAAWKDWEWAYQSKIKIAYYVRLKLLEKSFRFLKELTDKKKKVIEISQRASEGRRSVRNSDDPGPWKDLINQKPEVVDNVLEYYRTHGNQNIRNSFRTWKKFTESRSVTKRLNYQGQIYQELLYFKRYFSVWRHRFNENMTKHKAKELGYCFSETKTVKKCFDALKGYYLKQMVKHTMGFKADQRYETALVKRVFHALVLEREVAKVLCEKYTELYTKTVLEKSFQAISEYGQNKKRLGGCLGGFMQAREENLKSKGFYLLKKRADSNLIKRRSNKLAHIFNAQKVYTRTFEVLKQLFRLRKKRIILVSKKTNKMIKKFYSIWRASFKDLKKDKNITGHWKESRQAKLFLAWKKHYKQSKAQKAIVDNCTDKRNQVYLKATWAIWKKFVSFSFQKNSVGRALFISYVCKFKKQVLTEWRKITVKSRLLHEISSQMINHRKSMLVPKYFNKWMERSEELRSHVKCGLMLTTKKNEFRLKRILKSWAAIAKEKAIQNKMVNLWNEKVYTQTLAKHLRLWKLYLVRKQAKREILQIRSEMINLKSLKKAFYALLSWGEKRQRERLAYTEVRRTEEARLLSVYFGEWCDRFKDTAFDRAGSAIVDQYRKITSFKLFQRKVNERKETRNYCAKLNQFAFEVYKRRGFLLFVQSALLNKVTRQSLKQSYHAFLDLRRNKAFLDMKRIVWPRVLAMRKNMKAMKFYMLTLYGTSLHHWKQFLRQKLLMKQISLKIQENAIYYKKKAFINKLSHLIENKVQENGDIKDVKRILARKVKKRIMYAWKNFAAFKSELKKKQKALINKRRDFALQNHFQIWLERHYGTAKKKYMLANVVVKLYKKSIEQGFASLAASYFKKKKLEIGFDEIHERYITNLLKDHYDTWKEKFLFQKLANESLDGY